MVGHKKCLKQIQAQWRQQSVEEAKSKARNGLHMILNNKPEKRCFAKN